MDNAKVTALKGLVPAKRGKALGKMWRSLSQVEKAAVTARAAKTPYPKRKKVTPKPRKSFETKYHKFMKSTMGKFKGLPQDRMRAVAKAWKVLQRSKRPVAKK